MPDILVATDFSKVAENAVHYACQLASDFNASVTVIHSFIIPVTFSDTPMPVMPIDEGRKIAEERIAEGIEGLRRLYPNIDLKGKIMFGDIVDCIEEYTENINPWMIILGNSGTGNSTLWLGSNVLSALKNLRHTVMAIPPDATYRKPEKICFACDFKNVSDHLQTDNLVNLILQTNTKLHVLNVEDQSKQHNADAPAESTELHRALSAVHPVFHYVEKENVEEGIKEFIEANQMDWLIIIPHKYSFFEGLFHKSHTKAIMKMMHIPLIALHEK